MILTSLTLEHFRSHTNKAYIFPPGITVIVGLNASGKTNILEAIYYLATGKSFRAETDKDVISWNNEFCKIHAETVDNTVLDIIITNGIVHNFRAQRKKFLVNTIPKRMVDFVGNVRCVLFWPEHMDLVIGSPSVRRKYLDSVLVQVDREYGRTLVSYEKGLRQRNKLLERIDEGLGSPLQLVFWNQLLIKTGNYLTDCRQNFVDYINTTISKQYPYHIVYDKSTISVSRLLQYKKEEVSAHTTLVGPHRDDIQFQINKIRHEEESFQNLSQFGSRGEQRIAVLWLKLAELSYIKAQTKDLPLFLLDDIFSELDDAHRSLVWDSLNKQQTIIASSDLHEIPTHLRNSVKVIQL